MHCCWTWSVFVVEPGTAGVQIGSWETEKVSTVANLLEQKKTTPKT